MCYSDTVTVDGMTTADFMVILLLKVKMFNKLFTCVQPDDDMCMMFLILNLFFVGAVLTPI